MIQVGIESRYSFTPLHTVDILCPPKKVFSHFLTPPFQCVCQWSGRFFSTFFGENSNEKEKSFKKKIL